MRPGRSFKFLATLALPILAAAPAILFSQDGPPPDPGAPERGVARISIVNGEVSVRRGDSGDWVAAAVNAPVMVEDRLSTGRGSRAEVQFDSANLIRVGAQAEIRLAQLDPGRYNVQMAHGTVTFRSLRESQAKIELDTPTVSVRPSQIGAYRIYVQEDGQTEITVRLGTAEIYTPKGSQKLQAGQTMLARGNPADPEFRIVPAIAADEWDRWNEQRDQEMLGSQSYNNVPQDVYGAEDLDNHGQWVGDPSYGEVWAPAVNADWAPYQNGRWTWEDYYGWTWVSSDPWGWAPFHYGRWFYSPGIGWCWYPGGFGVHTWSPGLVAFFGFGPGMGVGVGFGNIGWVALAPFEPMYAWWGHGYYAGFRNAGYFNRGVNVASVNIANVYRNARIANAVSSVSAVDFRQGRFGNVTRVAGAQIREAGLVRGPLPVAPSSASLRYSNRPVASMPRSSENVRFFSHSAPAVVQRVPFADQQRAMQQFSRQSAAVTARSPVSSPGGAWRSTSAPVSPGAAASNNSAWRPVNTPQVSGWQRFGEPRPASGAWSAPRPPYGQYGSPQYRTVSSVTSSGNANRPQSIRVAPQVVRERPANGSSPAKASTSAPAKSTPSSGGSHSTSHR
jgi:hypothetical protein